MAIWKDAGSKDPVPPVTPIRETATPNAAPAPEAPRPRAEP